MRSVLVTNRLMLCVRSAQYLFPCPGFKSHVTPAISTHDTILQEFISQPYHCICREKAREYYQKRTEGQRGRRLKRVSTDANRPSKRPRDMTPEKYREHRRQLRARSRASENPNKKRWIKERNKQYQRQKRQKIR